MFLVVFFKMGSCKKNKHIKNGCSGVKGGLQKHPHKAFLVLLSLGVDLFKVNW